MAYQRILTIQDISCIGQCSMTVALPILSACGHEVCILPSAVLSTHTGGFGTPEVVDLSDRMQAISQHWKRQGITFGGIYTGYLGSTRAIAAAERIMEELLAPGGKIIVDPAMADHGKRYRGLDRAYADRMKTLCLRADVMLPNLTEAAMIAGVDYEEDTDEAYIRRLLEKLGGRDVVLTGVCPEPGKTGAAIREEKAVSCYFHHCVDRSFHGTGDIFASAFTGAWLQGKKLPEAARIAADYTYECIRKTVRNPAHWYGVKFETALPELIEMLK